NPKGPQLVLSRTDPRLLIRLFEMEVPEIYDGTVVIKGAVRQPGERAKVAVRSRERDVDPVGACVGMRGSRVQSIMRELHGEKIDVILYSDDLITFAQNALAPAKITRVSPIHHEDGSMSLDCVVEDDQLSLAIGKKGQNVRLASALIGLKIEIKGETEVKGEVAQALTRMLEASRQRQIPIAEVTGIGEKTAEKLAEAGIGTLGDLLEKDVTELAELPGIGDKSAEKILAAAREFEQTRMAQAASAAAEESAEDGGESAEASEGGEGAEASEGGETAEETAAGAEETESETAQETTVREKRSFHGKDPSRRTRRPDGRRERRGPLPGPVDRRGREVPAGGARRVHRPGDPPGQDARAQAADRPRHRVQGLPPAEERAFADQDRREASRAGQVVRRGRRARGSAGAR